ncbi:IS1096 element passenger TnpR family protein [Streptosporangium roseum]|uniref:IS1096 element passenger TnpR family protein n=1 Tax=Streptosporangium roseum TaxID=2001 RepID=UPI0034285113
MGSIHQLKVTLREIQPVVWRRIHVPSTANLWELHNIIQVAMGWDNEHLHVFAKDWEEYGDNAKSEYDVTLARLLPDAGQWLAYRYDLGDCWDHSIYVEKIHRAAKNTAYPRCTAGGRACPPEDSGGPEGFAEHLRALRHKKGWKYRQARHLFGSGRNRWDPAAFDKDEVNAELAALAVHLAEQAERHRVEQEAFEERMRAVAAQRAAQALADAPEAAGEQEPPPSGRGVYPYAVDRDDDRLGGHDDDDRQERPNGRPENGRLRDDETIMVAEGRSPRNDRPETSPETLPLEIVFQDPFQDAGGMSAPTMDAKQTPIVSMETAKTVPGISTEPVSAPSATINAIRIGYARVSTRAQDHLSQMEALAAAHCREVVEETASTRKDRPKLSATIQRMKAGDTLVIYKPDRVARSVKELLVFLEDELAPRGINLEILSGICAGLHRPNGQSVADKMLFMVAAMAAEMERDLISERTLDGLAAAATHGRRGGRPSAVTDDVLAAARARLANGESVTAIATALKVGRSTLYRALEGDDRQ